MTWMEIIEKDITVYDIVVDLTFDRAEWGKQILVADSIYLEKAFLS